MTDVGFKDQQVRIARYRFLDRRVTGPLAIRPLHAIIEELESELRGRGRTEGPKKLGQNS